MDLTYIQLIYVAIGFVATGISSYINWKTSEETEPFNLAKFLSAYIRTAWAIIPTALLFADTGLTVAGVLALAGMAFGIDNVIVRTKDAGSAKVPATPVV